MQPDTVLARETGDPTHLGKVERLAGHAAHRRLDRDRADRDRDPRLGGPGDLGGRLVEREAGATRRERHEVEPAQLLCAVALVVVEVALVLHQHAPAGACQKPQGQMIGECAARHEHRRLFAEKCRDAALQFGDDPFARVIVLGDAAGFGNLGKNAHIGGGRQAKPVRAELDDRLIGDLCRHHNPA